MSMGNEGVPFTMPVEPAGSGNYGNNGGFGWGGDGAIWLIILFLIWGNNGWGNNGWNNGGGAGMQGTLTRADICSEFNFNGLENAVRGIQQGICDSTYALNNSINGLGMNVMQGFHGVDNAICNLGFATQVAMMQGQNALQAQLAECCCNNRVGQMQIQNQMASDTCAIQNTIQNTTRDVLDNQNSNARAILDALNQNYIRSLETENQSLRLSASQQAQNAVLMAAMDANKADILRRTGNDCPIPAYVVPNPNCCYGNPCGVSYNNAAGCCNG